MQQRLAPPAARLAGYLRVLKPDQENYEFRIGRVLTTAPYRGIGLGRQLVEQAMDFITGTAPGVPTRLHAQAHLQRFYNALGFESIAAAHDDSRVPHV